MARHQTASPDEREAITRKVNGFLLETGWNDTRLARQVGESQSFVWNVKHGNFTKLTPRLRRLIQYIHMETGVEDDAVTAVHEAINRFVAAGGDLTVLRSSIASLTEAYAAA